MAGTAGDAGSRLIYRSERGACWGGLIGVAEGDIGRARRRNPRVMQPQPPMRAVPERPSLRTQRTELPLRVNL